MKEKSILFINYLNLVFALYLTGACMSGSFSIIRIGFYGFFISYIIEFILEKKWRTVKIDKTKIFYLGMLLFFLLAFIYYPIEKDTKYFNLLLEYRLPLLGFGIVGFWGVNIKYKLSYFFNILILISIITILYLLFYKIGIINFISSTQKTEIFSLQRIDAVNTHMMFNFILNISLIGIWYILSNTWKKNSKWKICLYILSASLIIYILSISEGRSGFLGSILLISGFIFFDIWKRSRKIAYILILLLPVAIGVIASRHKRITENDLKNEARLFLWKAAVVLIEDSPIYGNGISTAQVKYDFVRAKYETNEFRAYLEQNKVKFNDSHNQYLQTTMEFGIFGLFLLLALYISPIILSDSKRKQLSILVLGICAFQSIFDMFITGPFSMIFCILTILILRVRNDIVPEKTNNTISFQNLQESLPNSQYPI